MKAIYICLLVVGIILLLATESENGLSNIIGLAVSSLAGYKLGLFEGEEIKENNTIKQ